MAMVPPADSGTRFLRVCRNICAGIISNNIVPCNRAIYNSEKNFLWAKKYFYVRAVRDTASVRCPVCGSSLKHGDHIRRIWRVHSGGKRYVLVERLQCQLMKALISYIFFEIGNLTTYKEKVFINFQALGFWWLLCLGHDDIIPLKREKQRT